MPPKITMAKMVSENAKPNTLGVASRATPRVEGAGEAGHADGDAEDADLVGEHVLAERLGGLAVLADALQHPAEGRLTEAPADRVDEQHRQHERGDHPVARLVACVQPKRSGCGRLMRP